MFMVIVQREVGGTKYQLDLGCTEVLVRAVPVASPTVNPAQFRAKDPL